jgi:outer membrane protein assembly factor BamC
MAMRRFSIPASVILVVSCALHGCSGSLEDNLNEVLPDKEPQYKSSRSQAPLEIPPDLSPDALQDAMVIPGEEGAATYSQYASAGQAPSVTAESAVLPQLSDVRVERNGDKRWLVIDATPDQVWPRMRQFWLDNGILIRMEDPSIGIMETDWVENRADIPQGFIRRFLEKISTKLYSAVTRDKFRIRLERGVEEGTTELYLSHRGAEEVAQGDGFVWQPRPSDPELEAEMLNRMLVFFGVNQEQATRLLVQTPDRQERARMIKESDGTVSLALDEDFSRAWRRTGLALDRVGFTVEDRDRSRGLYYVRYVDPLAENATEEEGWLSKLRFWGDEAAVPEVDAYLISLIDEGDATQVVVLNSEGQRQANATADRILSLLHEQLK